MDPLGDEGFQFGGYLASLIEDASVEQVGKAFEELGLDQNKFGYARKVLSRPVEKKTHYRYDEYGEVDSAELSFSGETAREVRTVRNKIGLPLLRWDSFSGKTYTEYDQGFHRERSLLECLAIGETGYQGESLFGLEGKYLIQEFKRDGWGRVVEWNQAKDTDPVRFEYYPSGEDKLKILPSGLRVEQVYDEEKRTGFLLGNKIVSEEHGEVILQKNRKYDANGFLLSYENGKGTPFEFRPDQWGRGYESKMPDGRIMRSILDGLGRVKSEMVLKNDDIINRTDRYYDRETGDLTKEEVLLLTVDRNETLERKYEYDEIGNLTAKRGFREGAWTQYALDGLGRLVVEVSPERDVKVYHFDKAEMGLVWSKFQNPGLKKEAVLSVLTLREDGKVWLSVPIDNEGQPRFARSSISVSDNLGRMSAQVSFEGFEQNRTVTLFTYDSRGNLTEKKTYPNRTNSGAKNLIEKRKFDPDGNLVRLEVENLANVFTLRNGNWEKTWKVPVSKNSDGKVKWRSSGIKLNPGAAMLVKQIGLDQVTTFEYRFGRLHQTTFPDGLKRYVRYDEASYPKQITWLKIIEGTNTPIDHHFTRDDSGRVLEIKNSERKTLQEFDYDRYGNVKVARDSGSDRFEVTTERTFDNLGGLIREITRVMDKVDQNKVGEDLRMTREISYQSGKTSIALAQPGSLPLWHKMSRTTDLVGRVKSIEAHFPGSDRTERHEYDYLGHQQLRKTIFDANKEIMSKRYELSGLMEPEQIDFRVPDNQGFKGDLNYSLDQIGRVEVETFRLQSKSRSFQKTNYFEYDSFGRLVAECSEIGFADSRNPLVRRSLALKGGEPLSYKTNRKKFDQVGNLSNSYVLDQKGEPVKETVYSTGPIHYTSKPFQSIDKKKPITWDPGWFSPERTDDVPYKEWQVKDFATQANGKVNQIKNSRGDLASNRLHTYGSPHFPQPGHPMPTQFTYDDFGRLTKFESTRPSDGKSFEWDLEFDVFNRLKVIEGTEQGSNKPSVRILFATDAFNRRIVKFNEREDSLDLMSFIGDKPYTVRRGERKAGGSRDYHIRAQYLWGAGAREPLSVTSKDRKGGYSKFFLHQDRQLNVIMATESGRQPEEKEFLKDIAGYLGFGENNTYAEIEIQPKFNTPSDFSLKKLTDGLLDEDTPVSLGGQNRKLEIKLKERSKLSLLKIWTSNFPDTFDVFVGSDSEPLVRVKDGKHPGGRKKGGLADPYELSLGGKIGDRIFLSFPDEAKESHIREIEVVKLPDNPSELAFSGSWLDTETGLYLHGIRYRLPSMGGKFISPDPLGYVDGPNTYAYAKNNPLTWHDPEGEFAHILLGAGVGAALGGGAYAVEAWVKDDEFDWKKMALYTGAGAVSGGLAAATGGASLALMGQTAATASLSSSVVAATASGAVAGGVQMGLVTGGETYMATGNLKQSLIAASRSGAQGAVVGALTGGALGGLARGVGALSKNLGKIGNSKVSRQPHGNSRNSSKPSYFYQLLDKQGKRLKWGITDNPSRRLTQHRGQHGPDIRMHNLTPKGGSRDQLLRVEKNFYERFPGPLNREPTAGKYSTLDLN